jgi:hypothetical protein
LLSSICYQREYTMSYIDGFVIAVPNVVPRM